MKEGIEPAIADVFDSDAVKAVVGRAQPEVVIEQLTALPQNLHPCVTECRRRFQYAPSFRRGCQCAGSRANSGCAALSEAVDCPSGRCLALDWQMKKRLSHLMPRLRLPRMPG